MKINYLMGIGLSIIGGACASFYIFHPKPESPLIETSFQQLPHWNTRNHEKSFKSFQVSCQALLKKDPKEVVGLANLNMKIQDWLPACQNALQLTSELSNKKAQNFFEHYFTAYQWREPKTGLLTGYYSPLFKGSLQQTKKFPYPVYGVPNDLIQANLKDFSSQLPNKIIFGKIQGHQFVPYDDRAHIRSGSIGSKAAVLAWVAHPMDALELEIQGAGAIQTPNGLLTLNYAAQNNQPYQAIGKFLIEDKKLLSKDVTMTAIRQYFKKHPAEINHYFNKNPSFVFFKLANKALFLGVLNTKLSPGYSMAVDPNYIPLGTPVFVSTELPNHHAFNRLLIAQDVGGAIKGPIRGDIYWGTGKHAKNMASDMKQQGSLWILLPRK
jgi:membrane-bound lytic murein transglycosylase A